MVGARNPGVGRPIQPSPVEVSDYIKTGAPPNPCVMMEARRGEAILGYLDGEIVVWHRGRLRQLPGHSGRVTALEASLMSRYLCRVMTRVTWRSGPDKNARSGKC
jgi:hypothetical protein